MSWALHELILVTLLDLETNPVLITMKIYRQGFASITLEELSVKDLILRKETWTMIISCKPDLKKGNMENDHLLKI